jgi:hypothetical protein
MKKKVIIVVAVLLIVILCVYFFTRTKECGLKSSSSVKTTSKNVDIELAQDGYITPWVYSSDDSRVHVRFSPNVNLSLVSDDYSITPTSVEIINAGFSKEPKIGDSLRLYPTDLPREESCLGNYFEGCENTLTIEELVDMGDKGTYVVSETPTTYGELPEYLGPMSFSIYLFDIGTYDYDAILDRDGVFNSAILLDYSGVNLSDLDSTIEFDVVVKLSNDTQVSKHFKGNIDGSSLGSMGYQGELVME